MNFLALTEEYRRLREQLLAEFDDIDPETLADTLEGMTALPDIIDRLIRDAIEDEAMAEGLSTMLKNMGERKARFERRAERRRAIALSLMQAGEQRKIIRPDFTASVRAVPPRLIIDNADELPDKLIRRVTTRVPERDLIKEALADGPVAGVHMTNGGEIITIRTR